MTRKKRTRRSFSSEQKAAIVRRHMVDKVVVSDLCDEYKIQPSVFYQWQRVVFENLEAAFERQVGPAKTGKRERDLTRKVTALETRLARKDSVIAEVSEEFVKLKKALGEL